MARVRKKRKRNSFFKIIREYEKRMKNNYVLSEEELSEYNFLLRRQEKRQEKKQNEEHQKEITLHNRINLSNRFIKFKAKLKAKPSKWVFGYPIYKSNKRSNQPVLMLQKIRKNIEEGTYESIDYEIIEHTICQYTGFKKVYENDIFYQRYEDRLLVVKWHNSSLSWRLHCINTNKIFHLSVIENKRFIGDLKSQRNYFDTYKINEYEIDQIYFDVFRGESKHFLRPLDII